MTSESEGSVAFVWMWLPGKDAPVVAGRLDREADRITFTYGRSYLARGDAIPLYLPELPLRTGRIDPAPMRIAGCIADAGPDAWGQRVILNRHVGKRDVDAADLAPLTYLLESGSDRIGALDFQLSATTYVPRGGSSASLDELAAAADHVERGVPLPPALDEALLHGSSIGGARPKALLRDGKRSFIAKFSSTTDPYSVVKGEFIAMEMAARAGLSVAPVRLTSALGKDVLLVERFDRTIDGGRHGVVSALRSSAWTNSEGAMPVMRTSPERSVGVSKPPSGHCTNSSRGSHSASSWATPMTTPAITRRSGTAPIWR